MNAVIWKYELTRDINKFDLPLNAKPLSVQVQRGVICLWCLVDPSAKKTTRAFQIVGTGNPGEVDPDSSTYIGTVQLPPLVFHVFEVEVI